MTIAYSVLSSLGDGWWYFGMAIVLGVFHRWDLVELMVFALLIAVTIFLSLKLSFGKSRPSGARDWSHRIPADIYSFPSGHATTAFAVSTAIFLSVPRMGMGITLFPVATMIAIARVKIGNHDWADVIGGALIGGICGIAAKVLL